MKCSPPLVLLELAAEMRGGNNFLLGTRGGNTLKHLYLGRNSQLQPGLLQRLVEESRVGKRVGGDQADHLGEAEMNYEQLISWIKTWVRQAVCRWQIGLAAGSPDTSLNRWATPLMLAINPCSSIAGL